MDLERGPVRVHLGVAMFVTLAGLFAPTAARAVCVQSPAPVYFYPPNGATQVPTNAILRAHVAVPGPDAPAGVLLDGPLGPVAGITVVGDNAELRFQPDAPLAIGRHVARFMFAGGSMVPIAFDTAATTPTPEFSGALSFEWWYYKERAPCTTDAPAFLFTVGFEPAAGMAARDTEYWFVQLRGTETIVIARMRGAEMAAGSIEIPSADLGHLGPSCFELRLRTLDGAFTGGSSHCTELNRGPNFRAVCATAGAGRSSRGHAGLVGLSLALFVVVLRRSRSRRAGPR